MAVGQKIDVMLKDIYQGGRAALTDGDGRLGANGDSSAQEVKSRLDEASHEKFRKDFFSDTLENNGMKFVVLWGENGIFLTSSSTAGGEKVVETVALRGLS